jgi:hypothetical protein
MRFPHRLWPLGLAASLLLGGCAVVPAERYEVREHRDYYGYGNETVIITSTPRVEYRGYPPAAGYIWIDGYWNRVGARQVWVPGYWRPPHAHPRPIVRDRDRDRDDDRRSHWREERRSDDRDRTRERDRPLPAPRDGFVRNRNRDGDREADDTRQRSEVRTPALMGSPRLRGDGPVTAGERRDTRKDERTDRRDSSQPRRDRDRNDDRRDARPDWRTRMQSIRGE